MISVQRVMGSETEFGVLAPSKPMANPTLLSAQVVGAFDGIVREKLRVDQSTAGSWAYDSESPLNDSRGFTMDESVAHESQLTHQMTELTSEDIASEAIHEMGIFQEIPDFDRATMNLILPNGARLYVDHAHPEYSSPEVLTPLDVVRWDSAGDRIAEQTVNRIAADSSGEIAAINLYKNNTDGKGQSYGSHENYMVDRGVPFNDLVEGLIPFFVSRQIITGAGRVGIGTAGESAGFQISQRSDFFERLVGLETTIRRPIINTRDEPHADSDKYRRLHVIVGDANLAHTSTFLKFGMTSLVLGLIENGLAPKIELHDPVSAMHMVSHDLSLSKELTLVDGSSTTALEIQHLYLQAVRENAADDAQTQQVLELWEDVLDRLENDLMSLADTLDWVIKYALCKQFVAKGLSWDNPKLQVVDVQYSDVRRNKGLFYKLTQMGKVKALVDEAEIQQDMWTPPSNTRAYLRGLVVSRWPQEVVSVGWDTIAVRNPVETDVHRIFMGEPTRFTKLEIDKLLPVTHPAELFTNL